MQFISWLIRIFLFVIALGFAITNTQTTELSFFMSPVTWKAPLVIILLAFFVAGVLMGLLAVVPTLYRNRREIARLRKEVALAVRAQATPAAAPSADTPAPEPASGALVPRI